MSAPRNDVPATASPVANDVIPLPRIAVKSKSERPIPCEINLQKDEFRVYSWNVRSAKQESTRLVMAMEMNRYQEHVLCLSETRLNGVSEETIPVRDSDKSYLFLNSGAYNGSGDPGVGFMICRRAQKALLEWDPVNPRIARLRLKGRLSNISIIAVYAPTRAATDADKDSFYTDLEITMQKCPKRDFLILAGDWNSRVGPTYPNVRDIVGPFTYVQRCCNGDRLLQFREISKPYHHQHYVPTQTLSKNNLALKRWLHNCPN